MSSTIYVFDPTVNDHLSKVRGVGRYLQILKENFPEWNFTNNLKMKQFHNKTVFINPFFNFLKPPLTFKRLAKKQIAVIHDLIPLKYPDHFPAGIKGNINIFSNKLTLKNYDLIITDSETSKKDIINILKLSENKIKVIYPCLPKQFTNYKSQIINDKSNSEFLIHNSKFCLYVGDATWNKNLVNLAKAIKLADVTCVFVGKVFESGTPLEVRQSKNTVSSFSHSWQKEFKQFIEEIKNDKRFIFLGFIKDQDLIKLYQQATVNLLVSRDEGFGFSYVEASSQKCPSVLSNISVLKEIAENSALFASVNDPGDIANKIEKVYLNEKLRNEFGLKAYQKIEHFSQQKLKSDFQKILNF